MSYQTQAMSQTYYDLLDNPPVGCEAIAELFSWSGNYDYPTPATLFLDLTNYSEEYIGARLCAEKMPTLGNMEQNLLGAALQAFATRPLTAEQYVIELLEAEE